VAVSTLLLKESIPPRDGGIPGFVNIEMIGFPYLFLFSETVCRLVCTITWKEQGSREGDAGSIFSNYDHSY